MVSSEYGSDRKKMLRRHLTYDHWLIFDVNERCKPNSFEIITRLWVMEARVYPRWPDHKGGSLSRLRRPNKRVAYNLARVAQRSETTSSKSWQIWPKIVSLDMLWKIAIRQVRQGKMGVQSRDRSAHLTFESSAYPTRQCLSHKKETGKQRHVLWWRRGPRKVLTIRELVTEIVAKRSWQPTARNWIVSEGLLRLPTLRGRDDYAQTYLSFAMI